MDSSMDAPRVHLQNTVDCAMQKGFYFKYTGGWPNLILMVVSPVAHAKVTYLALGDSYTSGVGVRPHEAFPEVLVRQWSALGCRVNCTTKHVGDERLEGFSPAAKNCEIKPDLVSLGVGTNDIRLGVSVGEYLHWVGAILDELVSQGFGPSHLGISAACLAFGTRGTANGFSRGLMQQRNLFNKLKKAGVVQGRAVPRNGKNDAKTVSVGDLSPDLFHPSPRAYAAWAKWVVTNLEDPCLWRARCPMVFRSAF